MIAKVAEMTSLGMFAAVSMAEAITPALPRGPLLQLGALAIVGFMVAQNYRQRTKLGEALDRKDAEIQTAHQRANALAADFADAMQAQAEALKGLSDALARRPCVAGNKTHKGPNVQT